VLSRSARSCQYRPIEFGGLERVLVTVEMMD
jgi:hypothetical protein